MTNINQDELRKLADTATEGQWKLVERAGYREVLAPDHECTWYGEPNAHAVLYCDTDIDETEQDANAGLIVYLRNNVPTILSQADEIARLTHDIDRAQSTCTELATENASMSAALKFIADLDVEDDWSQVRFAIFVKSLQMIAAKVLGRPTVSQAALDWAEGWARRSRPAALSPPHADREDGHDEG